MASRDHGAIASSLVSTDLDEQRAALDELAARPAPLDVALALAVVGCLAGPRKDVQRRAVDVLQTGGGAGHEVVLDALRAACVAADPAHRWGAVYALGRVDRFEAVMIAPLLEALGNPDGDQRWAAAQLVVANGAAHGVEILPALFAALRSPEPLRRKMILYVLRDLRLDSTTALEASVPAFIEALQGAMHDTNVGVRLAALSGLMRFDRVPSGAGDLVLAMAADDEDAGARRAAVSALGSVGLSAAAVGAVLDAAAASADAGLRRAAEIARRRLADA